MGVGMGVGVLLGVGVGVGVLLGGGVALEPLVGEESIGEDVGAHPAIRRRASAPLVTHDLRISTCEL